MELDLEEPYLIIRPCATEDDFYGRAGEDSDWEFLDGRIVMHSPASDRHEDLFRFLLTLLSGFLDEKGGGVVRGSRYPMRLEPRWSPEPDILFVRAAREHLMTPQRLEGPADWVVEIASEGDLHLLHREKLPKYREAGIPEIWVVDPFAQEVLVEVRSDSKSSVEKRQAGRIGPEVLPGFWIQAEWLWVPKLPSTVGCLRQILG